MNVLLLMLHISGIWAASNNTSYKEMIQGYFTGQLSSVLGSYQVETLKREFKSFTGLMEKNFQDFKENIEIEMNKIKDRTSTTKESSNIKSIIYIYLSFINNRSVLITFKDKELSTIITRIDISFRSYNFL